MTWSEAISGPAAEWFTKALGQPSAAQQEAWPVIRQGGSVLVCAPTGTGKTMCAFLVCLDRLMSTPPAQRPAGVSVVYVSPLKSLTNDIAENLQKPLDGLTQAYKDAGRPVYSVTMGVRTGDTASSARQRMAKKPPDILITTPESLYLLLTTKPGCAMLSDVRTVIVDEVHALLDGKRGAHLCLTLERLAEHAAFQRIGLSATVHPVETAAVWLGGFDENAAPRPVRIVQPEIRKRTDLRVDVSVPDLRSLPESTIWPSICDSVCALAQTHHTTLVFANNRATAEKVALGVNAQQPGLCRTHHGCVSREMRLEAESALRVGELRCLVATSSMELGIDVGHVDLVVQVGSPRSSARGLQRMGRAGHRPGEVSTMRMFARNGADLLDAALVSGLMRDKLVEPAAPPEAPLDVLAQHIVASVCVTARSEQGLLALARRAYPYRALPQKELRSVLCMLRGDFDGGDRVRHPRVFFDEGTGEVSTDDYGRLLARTGSTIPDRGLYSVVTPEGVKLGELDEEYVFEARVGDRFMLGAFAWQIASIRSDRVTVQPSGKKGARPPFWKGDGIGRPYETGARFGHDLRVLEEASLADRLESELQRYPMSDDARANLVRFLQDQMRATDGLPTHDRLLIEHFADETGQNCHIHCPLGGRVNSVLAMLLEEAARRATDGVQVVTDDNGILLHAMNGELPDNPLLLIPPGDLVAEVARLLPSSAMFALSFRYAASTALMLGVRSAKRVPLWVQRLRSAEALSDASTAPEHPLLLEAYRTCMFNWLDLPRAGELVRNVRSGAIAVRVVRRDAPSPMARALAFMYETAATYDYSPVPDAARQGVALVDPKLIGVLPDVPLTPPARERPADIQQFVFALRRDAGWTKADVEKTGHAQTADEGLRSGMIEWVEPVYVAASDAPVLRLAQERAGEARARWTRRLVLARGPVSCDALAMRMGLLRDDMAQALAMERIAGALVALPRPEGEMWAHEQVYAGARRAQLHALRGEVRTALPSAYAALLALWQQPTGTGSERTNAALRALRGWALPARMWEDVVLPARVPRYRTEWLDKTLQSGAWTYRVAGGNVAFHPLADALSAQAGLDDSGLSDAQRLVLGFLRTRGASFPAAIAACGVTGTALHDALAALCFGGFAVCDSFDPVRRMPEQSDERPSLHIKTPRMRVSPHTKQRARIAADIMGSAGRWEATGSLCAPVVDEQLARMFDRWAVISREAAQREGVSWPLLLARLRELELMGRARRGYFVKGLMGMQFVREEQFERIAAALAAPPEDSALCLMATDPAQPYGHILPHEPGRRFTCVGGTAVVLLNGRVALSVERQGGLCALYAEEEADMRRCAQVLADAFRSGQVFARLPRLTLSAPPEALRAPLRETGFLPEMRDLTLWR